MTTEIVAMLTDDPDDAGLCVNGWPHRWVGGMCYIHAEDVEAIAATGRTVECEKCGTEWTR